jgi:hypothetical protein
VWAFATASSGGITLDPFLPVALLCLATAVAITRAGRRERSAASA